MSSQGRSSHQTNGVHDHGRIDNNDKPSSPDPRVVLSELAKGASRYSINLDGLVSKDNVFYFRGGYAMVWSGILRLKEAKKVIGRTASSDFLGNGETMKVAIKTPRGGLPGDLGIIKTFLKEVHAWSKLAHANVLPLIGITTQFDMTVSIISPWIEKGNAHDFVCRESVDPRPLIEGIASGLCHLHNCISGPLYHGDVNGRNVLISQCGQPLLTDFGLSFLTNSSFSLSATEHFGGSLPWMAPETMEVCGKATAERDVWAFAMTALELFTRKDPFYPISGTGPIVLRILKGPPDRPSPENTYFRLTDEWWGMCSRCWSYKPSSRPTMLRVAERIEQIMQLPHASTNSVTHTNGAGNFARRRSHAHGH